MGTWKETDLLYTFATDPMLCGNTTQACHRTRHKIHRQRYGHQFCIEWHVSSFVKEDITHSKGRSSLLPILRLTAECIKLSQGSVQSHDDVWPTHYPRPSRPENDLLISSSFNA